MVIFSGIHVSARIVGFFRLLGPPVGSSALADGPAAGASVRDVATFLGRVALRAGPSAGVAAILAAVCTLVRLGCGGFASGVAAWSGGAAPDCLAVAAAFCSVSAGAVAVAAAVVSGAGAGDREGSDIAPLMVGVRGRPAPSSAGLSKMVHSSS